MNDFLEIGKVIFFVVLGIVTILIAVLMAKGTPFLTKGMRNIPKNLLKIIVKIIALRKLFLLWGLF